MNLKQEWREKIEERINMPMSGSDLEIFNLVISLHKEKLAEVVNRLESGLYSAHNLSRDGGKGYVHLEDHVRGVLSTLTDETI